MDKSKMAKIIYDFVKEQYGVSFVEFENLFRENGFDYKGNLMILMRELNIVLWLNWNQDAVDVINEVINMGGAFTWTSPVIYYCDGGVPDLPVAKSMRGYKKVLHWLPVVMNIEK